MGALDLRVGVFGLGEAGSSIAADLADAGATVTGFDPAARPALAAVRQVDDPRAAVGDAELVLAITASSDAMTALSQALDTMPAGIVYADLSTASPERKRELAARAAERSLRFADVALMSTVPGKGLFTPALAAGPGAAQYRRLLAP
ncbi:MAG: NAD(P)-binding domain-containing protein, partial [Acidimicrobiia bacterium]|nr:NAD(P)-binding domain-containing protein [Acidimicrobiia bacterium]